jgi:hypothetical protein
MHTDDCARARATGRTCVLDMKGEAIDGGVSGGRGTAIGVIEPGNQPSLLHLRRDFIEILKTAEDL